MSQEYYTINQVAEQLQLHVKTVRRYVREGSLKATRIGKSYRIAATDLQAFSGIDPELETPPVILQRSADASCVVEISAISPDEYSRLNNTIMASMKGTTGNPNARIDNIYYEEIGRLKLILHGSLQFTSEMLRMIDVLITDNRATR